VWNKNIINFNDNQLDQLVEVLEKNNMGVSNIAGPLFKCEAPWSDKHDSTSNSFGKNVEKSRENLERAIEITKRLDAPRTRVFGYLHPISFLKLLFSPEFPEVTEQQWQMLVDDITAFVDMAKQEKITVLIENEALALVNTWETTIRILEDIADPYFKLLLDPGNYYFAGETHSPGKYTTIKDRVGHQHIKDGTKTLEIKHFTVVGKGNLNFESYFNAWTATNYKGFYSLETHVLTNKKKVSYKSLDNMKDMIK
jgi:sugar phosphate isomerase/epimerase